MPQPQEGNTDIVPSGRWNKIYVAPYSSAFSAATSAFFRDDFSDGTSRQKVEQRIDELMNEVSALRSCLNAATCTGRLPPEILSCIFLKAQENDPFPNRFTWIRLTHVCRHWRAVALSCPVLWSNIVVPNKALVDCMLHRSKGTLLRLDLDYANSFLYTTKSFEVILPKVFAHGDRLRSVKLGITDAAMLCDFPKTVAQLQELVLTYQNTKDDAKSHLPAHILQQGAPKLEHLTISGFTISWTAIPSPLSPTFLKIEQRPPSNRLCPEALGNSIVQMTGLRNLEIAHFLPNDSSTPLPYPTLMLNLQSLTLTDGVVPLLAFFQSCAAVQAERIHLDITDASWNIESVGACFAKLAALWKDPATSAYRSQTGMQGLVLDGLDFKEWGPRTQTFILGAWFRPFHRKSKPDLRISLSVSESLAPQVLTSFATAFDLSPIRWLKVAVGNCHCLGPAWREVIAPLPNLETIKFSAADILGFTSVMDQPWAEAVYKEASDPERLGNAILASFFPALSSIECHDVDFDPNRDKEAREYVADFAHVFERWPKTHPLRQLHIKGCTNFISEDFDYFQQTVPNLAVEWDGVEDEQTEKNEDDMYQYNYDEDYVYNWEYD